MSGPTVDKRNVSDVSGVERARPALGRDPDVRREPRCAQRTTKPVR